MCVRGPISIEMQVLLMRVVVMMTILDLMIEMVVQRRRSPGVRGDDLHRVVVMGSVVAVYVVEVLDEVLVMVVLGAVRDVRAQLEDVRQEGKDEEHQLEEELLGSGGAHHHGQEEEELDA